VSAYRFIYQIYIVLKGRVEFVDIMVVSQFETHTIQMRLLTINVFKLTFFGINPVNRFN
jgi:hypothetical protein